MVYLTFLLIIFLLVLVFIKMFRDDPEAPYYGLCHSKGWNKKTQGYVIYPDGERTINMPIGNAREYAEMFGGNVFYTDKN